MIKFFSLLSKKSKINVRDVSEIYRSTLDEVIYEGFIEIKDFINQNNNLENNPNLQSSDVKWFRLIIYLGNLHQLKSNFEEEEVLAFRNAILDRMFGDLDESKKLLSIESFLDYEKYFDELLREYNSEIDAMAYAVFEKYNINDFQGALFKRKNKPNPIFLNELKNLLKHFLWNWKDYLSKNKIKF